MRERERGGRRSHDLRPSGGLWMRTRSPCGGIPPHPMQQFFSPVLNNAPLLPLHVFNCHFISVSVDFIQRQPPTVESGHLTQLILLIRRVKLSALMWMITFLSSLFLSFWRGKVGGGREREVKVALFSLNEPQLKYGRRRRRKKNGGWWFYPSDPHWGVNTGANKLNIPIID